MSYVIILAMFYYAGNIKQEVKHDKFTDIDGSDNFYGMCITSKGVLWAAARCKGLLQFTIK